MERRWTPSPERGVVLLLAIIALLLISAVGAAILYMAASESGFVGSQRMMTRTFYGAVGGLEEVRYRMTPALQPPVGLAHTEPLALALPGVPVIPCNPSPGMPLGPFPAPTETPGTMVPCNTSTMQFYATRPEIVLYVINSAAVNPPAPGANAALPASPTNDPFLPAEVPNFAGAVTTAGSIQTAAGTLASVPYSWVRINLKTERASQQDINLDNATANDEPIFFFRSRQYLLSQLNPTLLPPPWGPAPDPTTGQVCLATSDCAHPVYMVTSYSTLPGVRPTGRVARTEISGSASLGIDAAILSQPPVGVAGTSRFIGYDGCDPQCPPGNPPYSSTDYPGVPGSLAGLGCNEVYPVKSSAATGSNISGVAARSYPLDCPQVTDVKKCSGGSEPGCVCVDEGANYPYDLDFLVSYYRAQATILTPGTYTAGTLPPGILGTFPTGDPNTGNGAIRNITYVPGDFTCTGKCKGAGVLVVDGEFRFNAGMEFWGLIIVRGDMTVLGGGSADTGCNIYGAVLTGGVAAIDSTLGGSICFRYNSCAQKDNFQNRPYGQLSFREVPE